MPTETDTDRPLIAVAVLASFVAFLDGSVVNLALPAIGREFGGGLALQQWVIDGYLLSLGALILVAGAVSDQFGRLSVLCALAPGGWVLAAARCLQGVGAAFLVPSSLAMINARFSGAAQSRAIGTWTAWTGTAFVIGPLLGGVLVSAVWCGGCFAGLTASRGPSPPIWRPARLRAISPRGRAGQTLRPAPRAST